MQRRRGGGRRITEKESDVLSPPSVQREEKMAEKNEGRTNQRRTVRSFESFSSLILGYRKVSLIGRKEGETDRQTEPYSPFLSLSFLEHMKVL